jgi:hypothetical protein
MNVTTLPCSSPSVPHALVAESARDLRPGERVRGLGWGTQQPSAVFVGLYCATAIIVELAGCRRSLEPVEKFRRAMDNEP